MIKIKSSKLITLYIAIIFIISTIISKLLVNFLIYLFTDVIAGGSDMIRQMIYSSLKVTVISEVVFWIISLLIITLLISWIKYNVKKEDISKVIRNMWVIFLICVIITIVKRIPDIKVFIGAVEYFSIAGDVVVNNFYINSEMLLELAVKLSYDIIIALMFFAILVNIIIKKILTKKVYVEDKSMIDSVE